MLNKFDDELREKLNKEMDIPKSILEKKELAFEKIRKKQHAQKKSFSFKKKMVAIAASAAVISMSLLSGPTLADIKKIFFPDEAVQTAVDHHYLNEVTNGHTMKDSGVAIKMTNIAYDRSKVIMSLNLTFDDKQLLDHLDELALDFDLMDQNGRYIWKENRESGLTVENAELLSIYDTTSMEKNEAKGEVNYYLVFYPTTKLEELKKLTIDIRSIQLRTTAENGQAKSRKEGTMDEFEVYKEIRGTWEDQVILPDQKKKEIHFVAEKGHELFKIDSVELLPTGLYITFEMASIEDDAKRKRVFDQINQAKIVDEKGKSYEATNKGYTTSKDGQTIKVKNFDVTAFEELEQPTLVITDLEGEDVEIKLNKVNE